MKQQQITYSLNQISDVVDTLLPLLQSAAVFTFTGTLGAGKTTLIKALLKKAGVLDVVTSPTFTYVNVYQASRGTFYHFDLYRIATLDDFCAAGFDEYVYLPNSWAFIEWPAVIMPLLAKKACHIHIEYVGLESRMLTITT